MVSQQVSHRDLIRNIGVDLRYNKSDGDINLKGDKAGHGWTEWPWKASRSVREVREVLDPDSSGRCNKLNKWVGLSCGKSLPSFTEG